MDSTTKIEMLSNHYNETCSLCKGAQTDRNKMFLYVCLVLDIQFLFIFEPRSMITVLTSWLKEAHDVNFGFQVEVLQVLLWLVLLYCTMRYYQLNCYVERQYKYIHNLEKQMSEISSLVLNRESSNYLDSYPKVLYAIHIIYTWLFPVLFEVIIVAKIVSEIKNSSFGMPIIINCILFTCCFVLTILHLLFLHPCKKRTVAKI